jgi:acyl dehydratase
MTSAVGQVIDTVEFGVEEGKVQEFARAAGATDVTAVPLTFAAVAGHWRDQAAMVAALGLDLPRIVVGGTEWEYHAPIAVGDRLHGDRIVIADEARDGKRGTMRILTLETALRNAAGDLAVTQRDTVIELPA